MCAVFIPIDLIFYAWLGNCISIQYEFGEKMEFSSKKKNKTNMVDSML